MALALLFIRERLSFLELTFDDTPVLLLCTVPLLEPHSSAPADSLSPPNEWPCDPFRLSHILHSFTASADHPESSAKGSAGLILFFSNWSFWPVFFCGNPLQEDYFSIVRYFQYFIRYTEHFGISYISQGNLKSGRCVGRVGRGYPNPCSA